MKSHTKSTVRNFRTLLLGLSLLLDLTLCVSNTPVCAQNAALAKSSLAYRTKLLEAASEALSSHDARTAIHLATSVLNADKNNARAYFIRGKGWTQYDNAKNALADFSVGLKLDAKVADPDVFLNIAQIYLQLRQSEQALRALESGTLQKPSLELYKLKASINDARGHEKEALLDIEKALKFDPDSRTILLMRGSIYDHNHSYDQAIDEYSRVITVSLKGKLKDANWMLAIKKRADDYEKVGKKELANLDRETLKTESSSWEQDLFQDPKQAAETASKHR
jgi:tetratricopeptide (TPR) repeat protein